MMIDVLGNVPLLASRPAWTKTVAFLSALPTEIEDGRHDIKGDDLFAIVMTYNTRHRSEGLLEAHRRYVDVQVVLAGSERCEWYPAEGLAVSCPYDEGKDAEFYTPPDLPPAEFSLSPGFFAVFFPGDAHMTSLAVAGEPAPVRKVVVKIRADLLQCQGWERDTAVAEPAETCR